MIHLFDRLFSHPFYSFLWLAILFVIVLPWTGEPGPVRGKALMVIGILALCCVVTGVFSIIPK